MKIKINKTQVVNSYKNPYIYHMILIQKPWMDIPYVQNNACIDPLVRFYEIARKTSYYYEILEKFPIYQKDKII